MSETQEHVGLISERIRDILGHEGSATFVTSGLEGPHLVATWQSYIEILDGNTLALPAGGLRRTEENIRHGSPVQMIVASRDVQRAHRKGGGYRLGGGAQFESDGPVYSRMKARFPWARAVLILRVETTEELV